MGGRDALSQFLDWVGFGMRLGRFRDDGVHLHASA